MKEPIWLDRTVIEAIHADLLREHGGALGIRDPGLLESALARPRQKWTYSASADLPTLAAAYGFGLAKNHAFVDGSKRVALMAIYVFLWTNGWELDASEPDAAETILSVANGSVSERKLASWVRSHIMPAKR
jgi:death-on-curing protein